MMDALAPFKTYQPSTSESSPLVHTFFDNPTSTWTCVVVDPPTKQAMIIDSVLDFEPASGSISTQSARGLVSFVEQNNYEVTRIMETHVHADHATAAFALKQVGTPSGKISGC
jgi:glyoxylase-like metal-dependent hydrolase (beta-lactamase superfamily II)